MKILITALVLTIICLVILCFVLGSATTMVYSDFVLLDRVEVQEYLNTQGYDLKIDGKIGPKTIEAWDEYTGERHASLIFKEAGEL